MGAIPQRPAISSYYRSVLNYLEPHIPVPKINPSLYQLLALILSVAFLYATSPLVRVILLSIILISDWYDGATARKYLGGSREGYLTDVAVDRVSEGLIFISQIDHVFGQLFFLLWILNTAFSFYSAKTDRHLSLPLRFAYIPVILLLL